MRGTPPSALQIDGQNRIPPHALEKGNTPDAAGEPKLRRGHAVLVIESHPTVIEMQDFYDRDS